jgi:hypothetical protein
LDFDEGTRLMNDYLKAFIIGFGLGASVGLLFGAPFALLLSLFGFNLAGVIGGIVVVSGLVAGVGAVLLAAIWISIPPNMRILIAVGILIFGLILFQPELDAIGLAGLALTYMVNSEEGASEREGK